MVGCRLPHPCSRCDHQRDRGADRQQSGISFPRRLETTKRRDRVGGSGAPRELEAINRCDYLVSDRVVEQWRHEGGATQSEIWTTNLRFPWRREY